jgi:ABC-type glycerol-3-phosphate transport system substrate-binding protein
MKEKKAQLFRPAVSRRTFLKYLGAAGAAAAAGPQILIPSARGAKKDQVVFISEESNPKAIAVYEKINAEFTKNTGMKVVMEYPGFANIHKRVATLIAAETPPKIV